MNIHRAHNYAVHLKDDVNVNVRMTKENGKVPTKENGKVPKKGSAEMEFEIDLKM